MAAVRRASVVATEEVVPGVVQLTVAIDDPEFAFVPGQSITLHFGENRRTYCIASAPQRPWALQLCIRLGEGEGSSAVRELRPGDSLEFDGPGGELIIPASQKPLVLIAGDTGIAPMRSIMLHFGATGDPRPVTILYETEGGELYPADFRQLAEARKITYETGLIEELIAGRRESLGDAAILAAGYQPFLLRVEDALRAAGIAVDAVRFESFGRL